jgi:hypothetical protein
MWVGFGLQHLTQSLQTVLVEFIFSLQSHTCELIREGERFLMLGFVARRSVWGDLCQVWGLGFSQWELWMVATLTAFHDEVLMILCEWSDTHKVMTALILDMGWFWFCWM